MRWALTDTLLVWKQYSVGCHGEPKQSGSKSHQQRWCLWPPIATDTRRCSWSTTLLEQLIQTQLRSSSLWQTGEMASLPWIQLIPSCTGLSMLCWLELGRRAVRIWGWNLFLIIMVQAKNSLISLLFLTLPIAIIWFRSRGQGTGWRCCCCSVNK